MQAIVTKYHGPGNVKRSRVSASAAAGRVVLEWDDALNSDNNHKAAALALAAKFQWSGTWFAGGVRDGFIWVNATGNVASFTRDNP